MKKVSSDIKWFCDQLREAEQILSNALEKAEDFSDYDKQLVDRIESDVQLGALVLFFHSTIFLISKLKLPTVTIPP